MVGGLEAHVTNRWGIDIVRLCTCTNSKGFSGIVSQMAKTSIFVHATLWVYVLYVCTFMRLHMYMIFIRNRFVPWSIICLVGISRRYDSR